MPEFTIRVDGATRNKNTFAIAETRTIPEIKRVNGIRVVNRNTGAELPNPSIANSLNSETREVVISGSLIYTTVRDESTQHALTGQTVSGSQRICYYANGGTRTTAATNYCVNFIAVTEKIYSFQYDIIIDYDVNTAPAITVSTEDGVLLREGETYSLDMEVNEIDAGDVVDIQYYINNSMTGSLGNYTSESIPLAIQRNFLYQKGRLVDQLTGQSIALTEDVIHQVRIEARDNYGGVAPVETLTFTVDTNIPPVITVNPLQPVPNALPGDAIEVSGTVADPNGDTFTLSYQLNNDATMPLTADAGGAFAFAISNSKLKNGGNLLRLMAIDQNGELTEKQLTIQRDPVNRPLLDGSARYRLNMPTRTAKDVQLKVRRETGDLTVTAQISMTGREEDEAFVPMIKVNTIPLGGGVEEDEYHYTADGQKEKVTVSLTMTRESPDSTKKVLRVSGELRE